MNILLYQDRGTAPNSVRQTYQSLKSLVGHAYDIIHVDARVLRTEPWEANCAMLVIPGGRDLPYCQDLQGTTNQRIRQFVEKGGRYLGICAGAYYGSSMIEFEKGDPVMQVCGPRELEFYPGISRGTTFPGFVYNSERGARSVSILVEPSLDYSATAATAATSGQQRRSIRMYYNGGGYFVHADRLNGGGKIDVLARYEDPGTCPDEPHPAAVVHCRIGRGHAVLIATHPEYDAGPNDLLNPEATDSMKAIIKDLIDSSMERKMFLCAVFDRMGLQVVPHSSHTLMENQVPDLTPLYLAMHGSSPTSSFFDLVDTWLDAANPVSKVLECVNDAFYLTALDDCQDINIPNSQYNLLSLQREQQGKPPITTLLYQTTGFDNSRNNNHMIPPPHLTPSYSLVRYFDSLTRWREHHRTMDASFGNSMLYAQVIESTQTLLDKNFDFTKTLPSGLICLAASQIDGRGRGRNSWISQEGGLQFSLLLRHSINYVKSPVVFLQYLISLAVVESIRNRPGYERLPLFLKWPNDIYAKGDGGLHKIGGLLVNSHYLGDEFTVIIGCGLNLSNTYPTISINQVIKAHDPTLPLLSPEDLLANILVTFESLYSQFCQAGIGSWFLNRYYSHWLHSDQLVTLETHDNAVARIEGIASDYGSLIAIDVVDRKRYLLQPDGNSFDMLKGLICSSLSSSLLPHRPLDPTTMSACPFSKPTQDDINSCPFGDIPKNKTMNEEATGGLGEQMASCTTYQNGGCPIENKAKDDIENLHTLQTPVNLSFKDKVLDRLYPETYPTKLNKFQDVLDDPQLALAMRLGTKVVHQAAENSVFTKRFLKGEIKRDEYGQYLRSLYFVYKSMEKLLKQHQQDTAIGMIYFPEELNREQTLLDDLIFFYGHERLKQVTDPETMTPAVKHYVEVMEEACKVNPALMVSHSYTRYLGDLSGGQILAKRLKKHILHLEKQDSSWDSHVGLSFYHFNNIGNQNEFKNMYRQQLDQVPVTEHTKDLVVKEAIRCFELNIALFDEIQALSDANQLLPTEEDPSLRRSFKWLLPSTTTTTMVPILVTVVATTALGCAAYFRHRNT